jgi:hypothetical protein
VSRHPKISIEQREPYLVVLVKVLVLGLDALPVPSRSLRNILEVGSFIVRRALARSVLLAAFVLLSAGTTKGTLQPMAHRLGEKRTRRTLNFPILSCVE